MMGFHSDWYEYLASQIQFFQQDGFQFLLFFTHFYMNLLDLSYEASYQTLKMSWDLIGHFERHQTVHKVSDTKTES